MLTVGPPSCRKTKTLFKEQNLKRQAKELLVFNQLMKSRITQSSALINEPPAAPTIVL